MWVPPTDWASSLFHSKCPAIWLLLSWNSEDPLSKFTVNFLIAKHKGSFSDFVSFVLSATRSVTIVDLTFHDWNFLFYMTIFFIDYLNVIWLFLRVSLLLPARCNFLEAGSCTFINIVSQCYVPNRCYGKYFLSEEIELFRVNYSFSHLFIYEQVLLMCPDMWLLWYVQQWFMRHAWASLMAQW